MPNGIETYELVDDQYVLMVNHKPTKEKPGNTIALAFDKAEGVVRKHGSPERVNPWAANELQNLGAAGLSKLADNLVVIEGRFPVDEVNKCIAITGYCNQFYLKLQEDIQKAGTDAETQEPAPAPLEANMQRANPTPEAALAAVKQSGWSLSFIRNQTPEICMAAVQQTGCALQYVDVQTPEICMAAVKNDGLSIQYVKQQALQVCIAAVNKNGLALKHVKSQTEDICMAAVMQKGYAIQHVKDQTPELCMAAVMQTGWALQHISRLHLQPLADR